MKIPKNIAIIFIGLGKYSLFYDRFYASVQKNFLPNIDKHYFVFSDEEFTNPSGDETFIKTETFDTPRDVKLHKFHFIKYAWEKIKHYEYVAYFDADNVVRQQVEPEAIFDNDKPLIGVVHPWSSIRDSKDKFESNPKSAAYLKEEEIDILVDDIDDTIHEIADNSVPIYYWDIGQYASHNSWLMTEIPEINSEGNAHDQIQANIYQYVVEGLYEHVAEKEKEKDDE